jgi:membrane-bound lytic murein transglycosylase A
MAPDRHPLGLIRAVLLALLAIAPAAANPASFSILPGWSADRHAEAIPAFLAGCAAPERDPALTAACTEATTLPPGDAAARAFFERRFTPHAQGEGILTGYFEPELRGSLTPSPVFATPLRARPPDLVEVDLRLFLPDLAGRRTAGRVRDGRLEPYPTRAAIMAGALDGQGLELVWVDSAADAFFLQIQGSGRVRLPDGRVLRVGYAGQNGHPYVAIGRRLVQRGALALEAVSLPAIRAWMEAAGPAEAAALMAENPSYVFFRPLTDLPPEAGPIGTLGVPLTPMRSLAVDRQVTALGRPVWVAGTDPLTRAPLRRLTMAQDTGGAIRGRARGDLFTGWGTEAEARAGLMREPARQWVLVPR